jgi:hypothetical protein
MLQRCLNPKGDHFNCYGGRGIKVCNHWQNSFENFLADMGKRPSLKHTLDRYPDKNGDYEPGNCQWRTRKEQARNTRQNRLLTHKGKTLCIGEWAEKLGIYPEIISHRLAAGWSIQRTLESPIGSYIRKQQLQNVIT